MAFRARLACLILLCASCTSSGPASTEPPASTAFALTIPQSLAGTFDRLSLAVYDEDASCDPLEVVGGEPLPDMSDVTITPGQATRLKVSPGRRTFFARALDAEGEMLARGCLTRLLEAGKDYVLDLTLEPVAPMTDAPPVGPDAPPLGGSCIESVAAGAFFTCVRKMDRTVWCWGADANGQLGDGTAGTSRSAASPVINLETDARVLAAGGSHACAGRTSNVRCWGFNGFGQTGDPDKDTSQPIPANVTSSVAVSSLGLGTSHSCAVLPSGTAQCWGRNVSGQLGNGMMADSSAPVAVTGLTMASAIAGGEAHTCALRTDGSVHCWGANAAGQLGDGTTGSRAAAAPVTGLGTATAIAAAGSRSCAVIDDGTVWCWGDSVAMPAMVAGLTDVAEVALGPAHACARKTDGTVHCWGEGADGRLGTGSTDDQTAPVAVSGVTDAVQLALGAAHSCARHVNGTLTCWGRSTDGQLGSVLTCP